MPENEGRLANIIPFEKRKGDNQWKYLMWLRGPGERYAGVPDPSELGLKVAEADPNFDYREFIKEELDRLAQEQELNASGNLKGDIDTMAEYMSDQSGHIEEGDQEPQDQESRGQVLPAPRKMRDRADFYDKRRQSIESGYDVGRGSVVPETAPEERLQPELYVRPEDLETPNEKVIQYKSKAEREGFGIGQAALNWQEEVAQTHAKLAVAPPVPQRKPFHFPAGRRGFLALLGTTAVAVATYIGLDKLFGSAPAAGGPPLPPPTSTPDINGQNASGTADALNAQAQQEAARLAEQQRLEEEARKTAQAAEAQRLQAEAEASGTAQAALPSNTPRPENTPNPETILNSVRVSVQLSQEARAEHKISVGYQDNMNMLDPGDGQIIEAEEAVRRQFLHAMYWAATNSQNPTIEPKRDVVETLAQVQDINGIDPKNGATITIVPWSQASQDPLFKVYRMSLSGAPSLVIKNASEEGTLRMQVGIDFSARNNPTDKALGIITGVIGSLSYASDPTIFQQQVMDNQTTSSRTQALGDYVILTSDGDTFPFVVQDL